MWCYRLLNSSSPGHSRLRQPSCLYIARTFCIGLVVSFIYCFLHLLVFFLLVLSISLWFPRILRVEMCLSNLMIASNWRTLAWPAACAHSLQTYRPTTHRCATCAYTGRSLYFLHFLFVKVTAFLFLFAVLFTALIAFSIMSHFLQSDNVSAPFRWMSPEALKTLKFSPASDVWCVTCPYFFTPHPVSGVKCPVSSFSQSGR